VPPGRRSSSSSTASSSGVPGGLHPRGYMQSVYTPHVERTHPVYRRRGRRAGAARPGEHAPAS
jgi:hypothetical protein